MEARLFFRSGILPSRILLLLSLLDRLVDFSAMHRHFLGGIDPKAHFVTPYFDHRDDDIVIDDNAFVLLPRQDEHV